MDYLLHIDTATDAGMVAISREGVPVSVAVTTEARNHAATINTMIDEVLAGAGITLGAVAAVVVCGGPGSYTGLRIGMATAKGICYALDIPLISVNRLTMIAYNAYLNNDQGKFDQYAALLLARPGEFFVAVYDHALRCVISPRHIITAQLDEILQSDTRMMLVTDTETAISSTLNAGRICITTDVKTDLKSWCFYALEQYKCHNIEILSSCEPFYLKQVYTHN